MKKSKFSEAAIFGILKQAENGVAISELCREHGMSNATFYAWRTKYGAFSGKQVCLAML